MISVLYVDDEEVLLDIGKNYLERTGKLKVDITTSVSHALELLSASHYDVIVSDYQMPEMDGIEFLKKLRASFPKLPFIIFTGKGREEVAVEAFEYGADFYLQKGGAPKPQFTELARKIITAHEHRQGEFHIYKLNRLYSLLSATNKAIVRHNDVHDLLGEICRISVENGGFRMAWAGMVSGPSDTIGPVAAYGHTDGYLENMTGSGNGPSQVDSPTITAMNTGKNTIYNSIPEDTEKYPWKTEAIRRGYQAIAAFPFAGGTRYAGALTLCAPETDYFDDQIISLLDEMACDLTFALRAREDDERRKRAEAELKKINEDLAAAYEQLAAQEEELRANYDEVKRGEDALRHSEEKYRRIVETANEGIWVLDADFSTTFVNKRLSDFLGYSEAEILGKNISRFMGPENTTDQVLRKKNQKEGIKEQYERCFIRKDGSTCWLLVSGTPIYDSAGKFNGSFAMVTDISSLKAAEERMARNEKKFRHIFDAAPYLIISVNRQGTIVDCNQRIHDVLHYEKSEIIGKPFASILQPGHKTDISDYFHQALTTGSSPKQTYRMLKKDGTPINVSISSSGLKDQNGIFFRAVCIVEDISSLKAAEEKMARNEKKFRHIFDAAPYLIISVNRQGMIVDCNQRIHDVLHYEKSEIIQTPFVSLIHADHQTAALEYFRQALTTGSSRKQIYSMQKKDGTPIDVSVSSSGLKDQHGAFFRVVCIVEDITEYRRMQDSLLRKNEDLTASFEELTAIEEELRHHHEELLRSQDALKNSEAQYRNLFENAILGIYRTEADGRIIDINPAFARIFGYSSPEEMKSAVSSLRQLYVHPEERDKIVERIARREAIRSMDVEFTHKDGRHIWLNMNARGITDTQGRLVAIEGTTEDMTDRRLAEGGLQTAHAKLQLLSSITRHDILNQLNALRAYLDMATDIESDPVKMELITKKLNVVNTIEEQILFTRDYQTMGMIAPSWQNADAQIVKSIRGLSLRNVRIESVPPDLEILADPLLTKVFYNLVDNSLRYGGDKMDLIRFSCHENGSDLVCVYEDNGGGIPPKEKPLVFNRGFGKNTGLGMFLAKEILAITGLTIQETGEFGNGARFEITVPKGAFRFVEKTPDSAGKKNKKHDARSRIRTGEPLRD